MSGHPAPLSDRLADNLQDDDLAQLRALERIALGRSLSVAANGRSPLHWTPERWLAVLTFSMALVGTLFLIGGDWQAVKHDMVSVKEDMARMNLYIAEMKTNQLENQRKLDALKAQIETIEPADEYYRTHPRQPAQFGRQ